MAGPLETILRGLDNRIKVSRKVASSLLGGYGMSWLGDSRRGFGIEI